MSHRPACHSVRRHLVAAVLCGAGAIPLGAHALTPVLVASELTTSTTVAAFSGGSFGSTAVTGLAQFDPALGTLQGVTFTVDGSYAVDVSLFTTVIDEALEHGVDADVSFQLSLDVPTGGGGGLLFASGVDSANFFCSGGAFEGACSDAISP
ncbi:MAG: choice-of-anchor E domain-containing protein, partial [Gammaproteobacteria bacterium]